MRKALMVSGIVTCLIVLILVFFVNKKELKEENKISNTDGMISYTIDGEMAKEQPSKENGYVVNKIECKNGSILVWDNDNWQVELVDIKSADRCMIDFTKDTSKSGYRIIVTSNSASKLDSTSKTTTNGGIVTIYPKGSTITSVSGCNGVLEDNKVIVRNVVENQTCNIKVQQTLADVILSKHDNITKRTDFSEVEQETKLWKTTDYDVNGNFTGTSYYYTGNPDNWVSFANKLWRVIRINGNGSVRLLYSGSGVEDGYIGNAQKYNSNTDDSMYVGWKYGTSGSLENNRTNENYSASYITLKNWYDALDSKDRTFIDKTAIYCSDREVIEGTYSATGTTFNYSSVTRLVSNKEPSLVCSHSNDKFTDGFGLMTADEIAFAGGVYITNNSNAYYYLNVNGGSATGNNWWWTMTPYGWLNETEYGKYNKVFCVANSRLTNAGGGNVAVLRPVISINGVYSEGDGSSSNPYKIVTE